MEKEISNFKPSQDNFYLGRVATPLFYNGVVHFSKDKLFFTHCFIKGKMEFEIGILYP